MRISGFEFGSMVDGPGVRNVVFTQGCSHRCPGCHNPETHSFSGGMTMPVSMVVDVLTKNWTDGSIPSTTISGGDPFNQAYDLRDLCRILKERYNAGIWVYTGFLWEDLLAYRYDILKYVDVLVDGPFVEKLKTLECPFRGSSNQRLVDCSKSLHSGRLTLWEPDPVPELDMIRKLEGCDGTDEKIV